MRSTHPLHPTSRPRPNRSRAAAALGLFLGVVCFATSAAGGTLMPTLEYSQDGAHFTPLDLISGTKTGAAYYGYRHASAHPGFGTARGQATTALYWDDTHDQLSLIFVAGSTQGTARRPETGRLGVQFSGLPASTRLAVRDDRTEIKYKNTRSKASANFYYVNHTDGLEFTALEKTPTFTVKMVLQPISGVTGWRLTDGDPTAGGAFAPLDLTRPLYLREVAPMSSGTGGPSSGTTGGSTGGTPTGGTTTGGTTTGGTPTGGTPTGGITGETPGGSTVGTIDGSPTGTGGGVATSVTPPGNGVPEPASLAFTTLAAAGLAARPCRRRRDRK